jgi:preprotein translocase subunit SecF
LFTALYVTKTIFGLLIENDLIDDLRSLPLTFPKWDRMLKPNWNWMRVVPFFVTLSTVLIVVGCGAFIWKTYQREMADIEFASGTSVQFELKQPMKIEEVRSRLSNPAIEKDLPSPSVVAVGTENKEYEVVTPSDKPEVKTAVLGAFGDKLKLDLPSDFKDAAKPVDEAQNSKTVVPVESADFTVDGFNPPNAASYVGGAAIVLRDLNPPISPVEIKQRIEGQRLLGTSGAQSSYRDYVVEAEGGPNKPAKLAVVLTTDPNLPFDKDALKWRDDVANPMWKLVNDAVTKPASLQKVTTFNPQVAGDAQKDATLAMVLSIVVILAYIWLPRC